MAHHNLGVLYSDQRKPELAIVEFQTAIKFDPKLAMPHTNLGLVYLDQHKPDLAIAEFQTAIKLDPKDGVAHNNLEQLVYFKQQKPELRKAPAKTPSQLYRSYY